MRCELCGIPMLTESETGYCSPRCLCWDFFGVPALKEKDFLKEMRANQHCQEPRKKQMRAYDGLFEEEEEKVLVGAIAQIKMSCDLLRDD